MEGALGQQDGLLPESISGLVRQLEQVLEPYDLWTAL